MIMYIQSASTEPKPGEPGFWNFHRNKNKPVKAATPVAPKGK